MTTLDTPTLLEAAGCACFNLRKATRAVTQLYDDALRPSGLRCTQFSLLTLLKASGTVAMTKLAEDAVMDRTTLARNLEVLERGGLVRIRSGEDARVREIELTRGGSGQARRGVPALAASPANGQAGAGSRAPEQAARGSFARGGFRGSSRAERGIGSRMRVSILASRLTRMPGPIPRSARDDARETSG